MSVPKSNFRYRRLIFKNWALGTMPLEATSTCSLKKKIVLRAKLAALNLVLELTHANAACFFNLLRQRGNCRENLKAYEASFRRESKVKTVQ